MMVCPHFLQRVLLKMGGHDQCAVGPCGNKRRKPDRYLLRSHVKVLRFHQLPKDEKLREQWNLAIHKGRSNYNPGPNIKVCSNHFHEGEPTSAHPVPTLFLTSSDYVHKSSPKKRRLLEKHPSKQSYTASTAASTSASPSHLQASSKTSSASTFSLCTASEQLTRESDVRFYTGFKDTTTCKVIFEYLLPKAKVMQYWKGDKQTSKETPSRYDDPQSSQKQYQRPGPARKLSLEQEYLLVLMRLRVALLEQDLAFRFDISEGLVSSIFSTWIRLMRLELVHLIIWPSRQAIRQHLPDCFKKFYPRVRSIIDCSEIFIETPSNLDVQAECWSEYKHHCTLKFLVAITPNGLICFISPCYGGRASDKFIVRDSGFLQYLEPYDQIMADRGFKIREDLMLYQASLAIPPSTTGKLQMLPGDVAETSKIANVRIYVEQAIRRIKIYKILSHELPMSLVPLSDDIVKTCAALCNLMEPLCE